MLSNLGIRKSEGKYADNDESSEMVQFIKVETLHEEHRAHNKAELTT